MSKANVAERLLREANTPIGVTNQNLPCVGFYFFAVCLQTDGTTNQVRKGAKPSSAKRPSSELRERRPVHTILHILSSNSTYSSSVFIAFGGR